MYQALYRKYRPKNFDNVVGQDSLVKTLKNSIINQSFCHAYMFFGPRGTGKTTLSKIFARSVNCLNSIDGMACGKCHNCLYSFEKECVDIIEIDAASNNGVDEIRELKNKISLVPAQLNYKVYIIDEVHMLSLGAFNALLKTLEEPPEHVIFILATTDPQKVPETIISRCQCFSLNRISENKIVDRLKYICNEEAIDVDDNVLKEIALASEGGMRDALGMLDKLHSFANGKITINDFVELNGFITQNDLKILVDNIMSGNCSEVLNLISSYNDSGKNIIQIINQVMLFLRNLLINYYISNDECKYNVLNIIQLVNLINEKMFDIKKSDNPTIYIEMLLLKFINDFIIVEKNISREIKDVLINDKNLSNINNFNNNYDVEKEKKMLDCEVKQEIKNLKNEDSCFSNDELILEKLYNVMKIRVNNTLAFADKKELNKIVDSMNIFNEHTFDNDIGYISCALLDAKVRAASVDNIIISYEHESIVKQNLLNLEIITSVYNKLTNSNFKFAIITDEQWESERKNYINTIKEGKKYEFIEEPSIKLFEAEKENDIISSSAIELFGDIVEMD